MQHALAPDRTASLEWDILKDWVGALAILTRPRLLGEAVAPYGARQQHWTLMATSMPVTDDISAQRLGGGVNRRECRSYECANARTRASSPGNPTTERLSAGIPSAPSPAGTETSGRPSQLP